MSEIKVSKVLHLSNITHNISRFDIIDEIQQVAPAKEVIVLRPNNQALVEMHSVEEALKVYEVYSEKQLFILGNEVNVKFSRYNQLIKQEEQVPSQCVLLVSIICRDNSSLTLRNFYSICSKYGKVERIRMFIHQAGPQALVQYCHLYDCIRAKGELEKATFMLNDRRYSFEVQYSKLKELVIHKNNNYSRDFRLCPLDAPPSAYSQPSLYTSSVQYSSTEEPYLMDDGYSFPQQEIYVTESDSTSTSSQTSPRFLNSVSRQLSLDHVGLLGTSPRNARFNGGMGNVRYMKGTDSPYETYDTSLYSPSQQSCEFSRFNTLLRNPALQRNSPLHHRDSDCSVFSTSSSLCNDPISPVFEQETFQTPSIVRSSSINTRKYILDGFTEMMPISGIVDYFYGINIKSAEYKKVHHQYSIILYGESEWSDAMLVNYLRNNPVNGSIITLRSASEPVKVMS